MLNALGAGFDCASVRELELAAALRVPQGRLIFANPCKRPADFRYAAEKVGSVRRRHAPARWLHADRCACIVAAGRELSVHACMHSCKRSWL